MGRGWRPSVRRSGRTLPRRRCSLVAAICGATAGLARAGLLDERRHTSAAAEYLLATGYAGGEHFVNERAIADGDLITAGPQSPVQFARATLKRLGLASDRTLEAYEAVFHRGDQDAFPVLMSVAKRSMSTDQGTRDGTIPSRDAWPEPVPHTEAGAALTDVILTTFRLNARFLEAAQDLAANGDLTAAWWQVLGGILDQPRSVAAIGRRMGMTRQGVQRVADLLVERSLAEYRTNPDHRRAKLLACTEAGYLAIRRISLVAHPWGNRIGAEVGVDELRNALVAMRRLVEILDAGQPTTEA